MTLAPATHRHEFRRDIPWPGCSPALPGLRFSRWEQFFHTNLRSAVPPANYSERRTVDYSSVSQKGALQAP